MEVTTISVELIRVIDSIRYKDGNEKNISNKFEREQIYFDRNDERMSTSLIILLRNSQGDSPISVFN